MIRLALKNLKIDILRLFQPPLLVREKSIIE